ncbi:uncharacterized protein LOC130690171 [Daphnia carinata]|uniref:uncharacterized protein LOC130690171 n=1 Tax=Daphnia carinata TaxID=120202 RepID=UPI00257F677B|nr:uncharacterized protein LOC130690171 [Daphnia carinata]
MANKPANCREMRLFIFLVLFVTWIYCDKSFENDSNTQLIEENRVKRTLVGSPTANPSRLNVILQTAQTRVTSTLIRSLVSLERRWLEVSSNVSETISYIVRGIISILSIVFSPLIYLAKVAAQPPTFSRKKRNADLDVLHMEFSLPEWMNQMESWMKMHKPSEHRYRCCFYPTEPRPGGLVRCFPLLSKYVYPWNNPCSKENGFRDVVVSKDYKLHY